MSEFVDVTVWTEIRTVRIPVDQFTTAADAEAHMQRMIAVAVGPTFRRANRGRWAEAVVAMTADERERQYQADLEREIGRGDRQRERRKQADEWMDHLSKSHPFQWIGAEVCDKCGGQLDAHETVRVIVPGAGPFDVKGWEAVSITEAARRMPLFGHCFGIAVEARS